MAICSPDAGPALIERTEKNDQGGVLADLMSSAGSLAVLLVRATTSDG